MKIPKLIHQIWIQGADKVPPRYHNWIKSWDRDYPDWHHKIWSGKELEEMIRRDYPEYLKNYQQVPSMAFKSDIARAVLMHKLGGIYVDTDFESFLNAEELFENYDIILSIERILLSRRKILGTALLISKPHHSYWISVLDKMMSNVELVGTDNVNLPETFIVYTDVYAKYYKKDSMIKILDAKYFYSINNNLFFKSINISNSPNNNAYGVHHFISDWGWTQGGDKVHVFMLKTIRFLIIAILSFILLIRNPEQISVIITFLLIIYTFIYFFTETYLEYIFKQNSEFFSPSLYRK